MLLRVQAGLVLGVFTASLAEISPCLFFPRASQARAEKTAKITEGESRLASREVVAKVGIPVSVAFDIAGAAGHKWWPEMPLPAGIQILETNFVSLQREKLGGRLRQTIVLRSAASGITEIVLIFRRSWKSPTPADPRLKLKIITTE